MGDSGERKDERVQEVELRLDGWDRFERAVDAAVKAGPKHKPKPKKEAKPRKD